MKPSTMQHIWNRAFNPKECPENQTRDYVDPTPAQRKLQMTLQAKLQASIQELTQLNRKPVQISIYC